MFRELRMLGEAVLDRVLDTVSVSHRQKTAALEKFERQEARTRTALLQPGWYQFQNPNRRVTGFSFMCPCRTESTYLGLDWLQSHRCGTCGAKHSLLVDASLLEVAPHLWEIVLAKLPVRIRQAGQPGNPRIVDASDPRLLGGSDGAFEYSTGDPGAGGFGNPRWR